MKGVYSKCMVWMYTEGFIYSLEYKLSYPMKKNHNNLFGKVSKIIDSKYWMYILKCVTIEVKISAWDGFQTL